MPHSPKIRKLNAIKAPPVTAPYGSEEWMEQIATRALVEGPFAERGKLK